MKMYSLAQGIGIVPNNVGMRRETNITGVAIENYIKRHQQIVICVGFPE